MYAAAARATVHTTETVFVAIPLIVFHTTPAIPSHQGLFGGGSG
jgi:hypothetical protein